MDTRPATHSRPRLTHYTSHTHSHHLFIAAVSNHHMQSGKHKIHFPARECSASRHNFPILTGEMVKVVMTFHLGLEQRQTGLHTSPAPTQENRNYFLECWNLFSFLINVVKTFLLNSIWEITDKWNIRFKRIIIFIEKGKKNLFFVSVKSLGIPRNIVDPLNGIYNIL